MASSSLCCSRRASAATFLNLVVLLVSLFSTSSSPSSPPPRQSRETLVVQTTHGTLQLKLWPSVAPKTTANILKLFQLGLYNTNHFFRVDSGFVAQLADAGSGGRSELDTRQRVAADVSVPLEAGKGVKWPKHDRAGLLSMARQSDPNSGRSSFSIMLGPAPHLDGEYTLFGEVVDLKAFEVFKKKIEALPTKREGIFVMPLERVEVLSSYVFTPPPSSSSASSSSYSTGDVGECLRDLKVMEARWKAEKARRVASLP